MVSYEHWKPERWKAEEKQKQIAALQEELNSLEFRLEKNMISSDEYHKKAKLICEKILEIEKGE